MSDNTAKVLDLQESNRETEDQQTEYGGGGPGGGDGPVVVDFHIIPVINGYILTTAYSDASQIVEVYNDIESALESIQSECYADE